MEPLQSPIHYIEKNGQIYINAKSIEEMLLRQAAEIRSKYSKTSTNEIPEEALIGIIAGLKMSTELISRAITVSEIDSILGNESQE